MKKFIFSLTTITLLLVLPTSAYSQDYEFILKWGEPGSGPGQFFYPWAIAVDSTGHVYVADRFNYRIQKFDVDGIFLTEWGEQGHGPGQFTCPNGIAVDSIGYVYVTDRFHPSIQKFDPDGGFIAKWDKFGSIDGGLNQPIGIAIDSFDNVYVVDRGDNRIKKFDSNFVFITQWVHLHPSLPLGIAVDSNDAIYVTGDHIQKFDSNGILLTEWGSQGCDDGQFVNPLAIATDSKNNVFVTDSSQITVSCTRIQKFDSNGGFITKFGSYGQGDGQFQAPIGIAVDSTGNVYVADSQNIRISKFAILSTVISVTIDIKPGESPNSINLGSQGNVPVAIFSTEDFDATTVDPTSITLAGASVRIKGKGTPQASFSDVNGDGLLDLIVHVDTTALELTEGDVQAELIGMSFDGQEIRGEDSVRIVN